MAQLDATNRRVASGSVSSPSTAETPLSPSSSVDLQFPTLDPNTPGDSAPPEVQDWIAKARASLEAFGGLIALSGPAVGSPENAVESDEEERVFDAEDETEDDGDACTIVEEGSSPHSQSPSVVLGKTDSKGIPPSPTIPFGLVAQLSIRKNARGKSAEPENQDTVGVAGADFSKPCEYLSQAHRPGTYFI